MTRQYYRRVQIRPETPEDRDAIARVHCAAFGSSEEARIVDALRSEVRPIVSLVAETDIGVVGHILFSPVTIAGRPELKIMGLAPMAVEPRQQNQGIGSALVNAGLRRCCELDIGAVVVVGHPGYYPRFGFVPAGEHGLRTAFEVPPEAFMCLELADGYLENVSGEVRYHPAFGGS